MIKISVIKLTRFWNSYNAYNYYKDGSLYNFANVDADGMQSNVVKCQPNER